MIRAAAPARMLTAERLSFTEEFGALDAVAPHNDEAHSQAMRR